MAMTIGTSQIDLRPSGEVDITTDNEAREYRSLPNSFKILRAKSGELSALVVA